MHVHTFSLLPCQAMLPPDPSRQRLLYVGSNDSESLVTSCQAYPNFTQR